MVYIIGAGPGDPGLITVKALNILRHADVVIYDRLIDTTLLCETHPGCILIDAGKSPVKHTKTQDEIIQLLIEYGRQDMEVVRLKGGDPFLFGRGAEEAQRLSEEDIPYVVIPGVSSLNAVTAYSGIPLTHRDFASSVGIATGHGAQGKNNDPVRWRKLAQSVDTIAVFMGVGNIDTIIKELSAGDLDGETPAALIENGCTPSQRIVRGVLSTIAEDARRENISPPALLIIGKTVTLAETLKWYNPGPLAGLRIGITRPLKQSANVCEMLRSLGAQPVIMPVIQTIETIDTEEVSEVLKKLDLYDYLVFSSVNGVESFFHALKHCGGDLRALAGKKVAAIGPVTAEALEKQGIAADVIAQRFIAEGLLDALLANGTVKGNKFLLVRSDIGRKTLHDELINAGAHVDEAAFYSTRKAQIKPYVMSMLKNSQIDIITFTSSSTVTSFFNQISAEELGSTVKIASIGPQTSQTLRSYNREPDIEASEYTTEGLVNSILSVCETDRHIQAKPNPGKHK